MEKLNKKEKIGIIIISLLFLGIAFFITHGEYVFGSSTDWGFQHIVFPEYFRMLFYKNFDLFPDFALNIGGGQNIYYFAYYGLLSPIILISYLFPFVSMGSYIMITSLLLGVLSIYLFYVWIKGFGFDNGLNFILTLMFAMAGPLLFHSHRHIMFVNYMPFLLLGLIGVRRYFKSGYKGLMIISIFLMIMTSYYYSVGGILCLTVYGVYEYLKINEKFVLIEFIRKGVSFALLVILGVMMAGILLLPVVYTLMNGRGESFGGVSLLEPFIPSINLDFLLYDAYSVGLLGISFISIIYIIFMKKEKRFLGVLLSLLIVCPIFVYILNGFLYLDGKALIPFLPLYVFAIGLFLEDILVGIDLKKVFLIIVISLLFIYLDDNSLRLYFTLECLLLLFVLYLYKRFKNKIVIFVPLGIICIGVCLSVNMSDDLLSISTYKKQNDLELEEIMHDIALDDSGFYRTMVDLDVSNVLVNHVDNINENLVTLYSSTYNTGYSDFFYNFNNNRASRNMFISSEEGNILFESYMGVKYLVTDKKVPYGYKLYKKYDNYKVYVNENTLPIGYATSNVINKNGYSKLSYPDNVLALIGNVVSASGEMNYESKVNDVSLDLMDGTLENLKIEKYKSGYKIISEGEGHIKLNIPETDGIYLLRFTVEKPQKCSLGDTSITVNGIINKLTCKSWKYFNSNYTFDYTLDSNNLDISFSKGTHYIKKVELYNFDYFEFIDNLDYDEFKVEKVSGDSLSGNIDVRGSGYFHLSIPYDEGFKIYLDGEVIDYEKVNETFIGFPISKGEHKIMIEFEAPNSFFGRVLSLSGIIIFIGILIYQRKKFA